MEKVIKNINQETGVTAEQLIKQMKFLYPMIKIHSALPYDEIIFAIHDATIRILDKMNEGKVNKYDYQQFKNYLFITLKNVLTQRYVKTQRQKNRPHNTIELEPDYMIGTTDDDDNYVKNDTITYQRNTLLNHLEGEQKEIIIDLMNYTTQKDLAIKYNKSKKAISYHINKLKKIKNG
jgi:hypothetical protein